MNVVTKQRYGDPGAPRLGTKPWVAPVLVAFLILSVAIAGYSMVRLIQTGDRQSRIGTEIAIGFSLLLLAGLAVGWTAYWRRFRRAFRAVRREHPESLVLGARLPKLDNDVTDSIWSPEWGPTLTPQYLVVQIDGAGVGLWGIAQPAPRLLWLTWDEVRAFTPVEYVESRVAYDGLAIDGPPGSAIILQVVTPGPLVRFPRGQVLAQIAARANAQR